MHRGLKVRIYPSSDQKIYLGKLFGCYRKIYNMSLDYKKTMYDTEGINVNLKMLGKKFHGEWTKNKEMVYLTEHNTKILKQSLFDLLSAYENFFKNPSHFGFPTFKSKYDNEQSARIPKEALSIKNDFNTCNVTINSMLKDIPYSSSDEYVKYLSDNKNNILSAAISKTPSEQYFLSFLVDGPIITKNHKEAKNLIEGIDLGINDFVITSGGIKVENIKAIRKHQKKLSRLQRKHSKKVKKSKNREKSRKRLAKYHLRLKNIKNNYLHHVANMLLDENKVIVMENLCIKEMMKNHNLARSIQELGLGQFKTMLKYKAEWRGGKVILIDKYFPSTKLCSVCGHKNTKISLKDRTWICSCCNTNHDRDLNAATNIKNEGIRLILQDKDLVEYIIGVLEKHPDIINDNPLLQNIKYPSVTGNFTLVEIHENSSSDSLKQEVLNV